MMYSVLMLRHCDATTYKRFMSYEWTKAHGGVNIFEYDTVYTGQIEPCATVKETLEAIYTLFNTNRPEPEGYYGRSMCVSDVIFLEDNGTYFCDSVGFKRLF